MSRAFDLGQAANNYITVLPDLTAPPSVGDVLTASGVANGIVQTKFNAPASIGSGGGTFLPMNGGGTISPAYLRLDGPAGTARPLSWSSALSARWQFNLTSDDSLGLYSFADNGSYIGTPLSINRFSGPTNQSGPFIFQLAPWNQNSARGSYPNGVIGNRQDLINNPDRQPATPLGNNPLSTTAGSPVVTVTWVGSGNASSGWIGVNNFGTQTWVNLQGATAVGGITPSGWFLAETIVDNDHFTVRWTANATATATGGGSAVTAQPAHSTTLNRVQFVVTSAAAGYSNLTSELYAAQPDFTVPINSALAPRYEHRWHWTTGPNDPTGTTGWGLSAIEWDLTNRGKDWGYQPNIYNSNNPTTAFWVGPVGVVPGLTSGGTPVNWGSVYTVFSGQNDNTVLGVYQAFSCMPNSLVGQKFDPTAHGGVGVDLYGSYSRAPMNNPISTTLGSAVVQFQMWVGEMIGMVAGDRVYIPTAYSINGVTIAVGTYIMTYVDAVNGIFRIVGTGNATSTGSGGGANVWVSFLPFAPYAPFQTYGQFQHGIITTPGSSFQSGGIIETQPGIGILWNDGTGTASVNGFEQSAGNIDVVVNPAGSGRLAINANTVTQIGAASGDAQYNIFGNSGAQKLVYFCTNNAKRFSVGTSLGAEGGSNAGASFLISRYADAGNWLADAVVITRATGNVAIAASIGVNGSAPPAKPTVTGAKGSNAALASLLTALASYGLLTDSTSA